MVIGLGISIFGTIMQVQAQQKAAAAQQRALAQQQRAETIREQAMRLDAQRKKRDIIRQGIIARSQALSTAGQQGAQYGTALPGAYGQIQGQTAFNYGGVNASERLGSEMFATNRAMLSARKDEAAAGGEASLGAGISSLGGAIGRGLGGIGRISG